MERSSRLRVLALAAAVAVGLWFFFAVAAPLLLPFLLAAAFAACCAPAQRWLKKTGRLPDAAAAAVCMTALLALAAAAVYGVGGAAVAAAKALWENLPAAANGFCERAAALETRLLFAASHLPEHLAAPALTVVDRLFRVGAGLGEKAADALCGAAQHLASGFSDAVLFTVTTVFAAYVFAIKGGRMCAYLREKLPARWTEAAERTLRALGGWCRAQGIIMLLTFGLLAGGFALLRVPHGTLLALAATGLDLVPLFGMAPIFFPWIGGLIVFGAYRRAAEVAAIYTASEVMHVALQPKLLGDRVELPVLAALAAIYVGYRAFGFWGMLLVPVGASVCAAMIPKKAA